MGTINRGILGGFSGTVDTIVVANWRGKDVIRSRPKPFAGAPSELQLKQQNKFKMAQEFLQPFGKVQKVYYGSKSGAKSRNNLASSYLMKEAMTYMNDGWEIIYNKVLMTKGDVAGFDSALVSPQPGTLLQITWNDNSSQGNAKRDDVFCIACYSEDLKQGFVLDTGIIRTVGTANVSLTPPFAGKEVHVYIWFRNANENAACNSLYLGIQTLT